MKRNVLLTGARGRIATELRKALPDERIEIIPFSRTRGDGIFALADMLTPGLWEQADTILHTAWSTVPILSECNVGAEWHQDIPLLIDILRAIAPHQRKPHFIFFSSGGTVYGNAPGRPSRESDQLHPIGWHGLAKVQAEKLVTEYCTKADIPFTILRISNPYGFPSTIEKPQGIIPLLIQASLREGPFQIWGDGSASKDYIHAVDFISAIRKIITRQQVGIFNLAYGESHTVAEIVKTTQSLLGQSPALSYVPGYAWDVTDSRLDNSQLRTAIDWAPTLSLSDGLTMCIRSLRQ